MKLVDRIRHLGVAAACVACTLPAVAANYTFTQSGLVQSVNGPIGSLSGSFSGVDLDGNSFLDLQTPGEITAFSVTFTWNAPALTFGLPDLLGFGYCLATTTGGLCDDSTGQGVLANDANEGFAVSSGDMYISAGLGFIGAYRTDAGDNNNDPWTSTEPINVSTPTPVPEPNVGWLLGAGLLALAARRRLGR